MNAPPSSGQHLICGRPAIVVVCLRTGPEGTLRGGMFSAIIAMPAAFHGAFR